MRSQRRCPVSGESIFLTRNLMAAMQEIYLRYISGSGSYERNSGWWDRQPRHIAWTSPTTSRLATTTGMLHRRRGSIVRQQTPWQGDVACWRGGACEMVVRGNNTLSSSYCSLGYDGDSILIATRLIRRLSACE